MLRALVWKEWRQQRSIVAVGAGLGFILPAIVYLVGQTASNRMYAIDFAELMPFLMAIFVWPLFAAIVGATTNGVPPVRLVHRGGYTAWGGQAGYLDIATGDVEILAGSLVESR